MIMKRLCVGCVGLGLALGVVGCGDSNTGGKKRAAPAVTSSAGSAPAAGAAAPAVAANAPAAAAVAPAAAGGWGTIKGKIIWGKDALPEKKKLEITKDEAWCKAKGDPVDEYFTVDPATKGVAGIIVYVKGKVTTIHPDYPQNTAAVKAADEKEFAEANKVSYAELEKALKDGKLKWDGIKAHGLLDQVRCMYRPQMLAIRQGMRMVVLNPEEIGHNVKVNDPNGFNEGNNTMPPKSAQVLDWKAGNAINALECNVHGWMKGYAMIFDHPYYVLSGKDGSFEIKNVPSGDVVLQMRNVSYIDPQTGGKGKSSGYAFKLAPGETKEINVKFQGE